MSLAYLNIFFNYKYFNTLIKMNNHYIRSCRLAFPRRFIEIPEHVAIWRCDVNRDKHYNKSILEVQKQNGRCVKFNLSKVN